jgi:hypothetical protein
MKNHRAFRFLVKRSAAGRQRGRTAPVANAADRSQSLQAGYSVGCATSPAKYPAQHQTLLMTVQRSHYSLVRNGKQVLGQVKYSACTAADRLRVFCERAPRHHVADSRDSLVAEKVVLPFGELQTGYDALFAS